MIYSNKHKHFTILITFFLLIIIYKPVNAAISSIVLTPANPTIMSTGHGFYLAGKTYNFSVNVKDPLATTWADISEVRLRIPNSTNLEVWTNPTNTGVQTVNYVSGVTSDIVATITGGDTYNNFTVTFAITFRWDIAESIWSTGRAIFSQAISSNTLNTTQNVSYGICSSINIVNFSQTGEASDGYVNPWHSAFSIEGSVVYNIPSANSNDKVNNKTNNEITKIELYEGTTDLSGLTSPIPDDSTFSNDNINDLDLQIPASFFNDNSLSLGTRTWILHATMTNGGTPYDETVTLPSSINCDRIQVTDIEIINGGGRSIAGSPSREYYRANTVAGVQIKVTAQMQNAGTSVIGNTTVRVWDGTNNYDVIIANGQPDGTLNLTPYPTVISTNTTLFSYQATNISGGSFENGQNTYSRILQPGNNGGTDTKVYWDNIDPPGLNSSPFTTGFTQIASTQTASSISLNWTALTTAGPEFDGDFDSYRIYYKKNSSANWLMIDRHTLPFLTYGTLGTIGTNSFTIESLAPLTDYDFRLSAVDIFGNEILLANRPNFTVATLPSSLTITLSDGITQYNDSSFNSNPDPVTTHPVRNSAIRIDTYIVTGGNTPNEVNLILANNNSDVGGQYGSGTNDDIISLPSSDKYSINCVKTAPNKWTGYIPNDHPLMVNGTTIRFIVETKFGAGTTYVDHDAEDEVAPGDRTDMEWRFYVNSSQPTFKPWPVRIFNNVITKQNPKAYPAYYLSDNAYVGGQNIKDQGWNGTNKSNKPLGIGLYYIHISAKRSSDGKVILSKIKKVVIRK